MVKYPLGIYNFKDIVSENYLYVDKTAFIRTLVEGGKYYFLGRPRRFGKSLFLSMLEYFFRGKRHLFEGLEIAKTDWNWDWVEYPVIRIDFTPMNYAAEGSLEERISTILSGYEKEYDVTSESPLSVAGRLERLILAAHQKSGRKVVVLVDEYEKPVTDLIGDDKGMERHRQILRGFYSVLKASDPWLKFVFLTGVTKFGQMSVFSGLNNIDDISMDKRYASICGITREEMINRLRVGIESFANDIGKDFDSVVNLLKINYDGYHFTKYSPDIYNPFSLVKALDRKEIGSYWSSTGTPGLLVDLLRKKQYNFLSLDGVTADENRLMGINDSFDDPVALFYQTGYLTIKDYHPELNIYTLGYPNKEVETAFLRYILPLYTRHASSGSFMDSFSLALYNGEAAKAMELLEDFTAGISYDVVPLAESEKHFQYLMYIISKLVLSNAENVRVEEKTSDGRIDLLIETPRYVYVIEVKRNSTPDKALAQILERNYALQYRHDQRKIFLIGVNFSTDKRRIDGFVIDP